LRLAILPISEESVGLDIAGCGVVIDSALAVSALRRPISLRSVGLDELSAVSWPCRMPSWRCALASSCGTGPAAGLASLAAGDDEAPGSEAPRACVIAVAPAAAGAEIGLTGGGVAAPPPPLAPEPPLETFPASTTMAAPVDPDFGSEEVPEDTDGEVSAGATAVEGTRVAAASAEVDDPPGPAAVPVVPEADVDVAAVAATAVDAEPEAEVAEPEPVEPEAVELELVVAAEPVVDAQDAAAVPLPACGDAAAAAHWDDTGELAAPPDAVTPSAASLAPVEPSVAAWPTVLASVSTVVAASVAQAATPAGTLAAEEHVGVVGDAVSARARGHADQSTKLAAANANHHATCLRRRIDVPAKAPLRRLMSMSPSDANVKKKPLAISRTARARAHKAANHYLAAVLPLSTNCSARSPFCIKTRV
jgi:hypothetical protein